MLEEQIKRIHDKLQQLTRQHALLQKENTQLRQQLLESREQTGHHQAQLDSLKQQVQVLRLGAGEWNSEDNQQCYGFFWIQFKPVCFLSQLS